MSWSVVALSKNVAKSHGPRSTATVLSPRLCAHTRTWRLLPTWAQSASLMGISLNQRHSPHFQLGGGSVFTEVLTHRLTLWPVTTSPNIDQDPPVPTAATNVATPQAFFSPAIAGSIRFLWGTLRRV